MDLKNLTISQIFESIFGKEDAEKILAEIQQEHDKGVTGKELQDFAKSVIKKYAPTKADEVNVTPVILV